ncbi:peptide chain release factor N(5)-glutamine methyltransferase [Litoribaculum gwangyangense]|uniref:Release factor glutamine methyltransferase n=1 Tax=Litoribaculum gwangyangense TaxID=1130722 RepID=A0ABP9CX41_9FLAO
MKLKAVQNIFHEELDAIYSKEEVDSFFFILIDFYYKVSRMELALNPKYEVEEAHTILKALQDLKRQKPIQYITGETVFYGLPFKVTEDVLIPRPETEELVEWVIKHIHSNNQIRILDIGTGSGCIAISIAKYLPNAMVYALDVSGKALKIAEENAQRNEVDIKFFEEDILKIESINDLKFDIIVSNPPYVRELEKELMEPNVLENEPHLALFVKDNNPLLFYEAISKFAVNNLSKKGLLFFEINEYLGQDMMALMKTYFSNIELKQDIFKKDRMIKGVLY